MPTVTPRSEQATQGEERWMYYSDRGCWAARGRAAQEEPVGRASWKGVDSDAHAKREEDRSGPARHGVGGDGSGRADVRLLRLGWAE